MPALTTYTPEIPAVDVAVIGAGINGLAVAREAAARGMSVALFDQDDLAARTSAISTRLIHGGLKYLERFELNLVYESIRERNILLAKAPHLVHPYPMLIPFSKQQSRPGWLLACGLMLHDVLSLGKPLPLNRVVFRKRLQRDWPALADAGLRWGGLFHDANVPVTERLAVELAVDAQRHGAIVSTHSRVESLVRTGGRITGLRYRDRETGETRTVPARVTVNAAGPWVDRVLDLAGAHDRRMGPTKGSHLIVDAFPGAPDTCIFFESPDDARPMFVLPWEDKYMIGTTDLPYDGSIDDIVMDDDETAYLLGAVNALIPQAGLTPGDVLWSYSGVRPLPYVGELDDPSKVSRDHEIVVHTGADAGLVTIIGGKLTTHRALGELVARRLERELGRRPGPSPTRDARLPGAPDGDWARFRADYLRRTALPERSAERLVDTYGTVATEIERLTVETPALAQVVDPDTGAIAAEAVHAVREEGALTLEDVVLRRTAVALNRDVGLAAAPAIAAVLVAHCGWSEEQAEGELDRYRAAMRRFKPRALTAEREAGTMRGSTE
ncbi:glycerol-3-phosphate dehydrogenase/oxidase [Leifsonia sp. 21MFCrub1.1]|uniref:glycerol-3-phosphate dehydrogenase/oxidase n=1 Tax=Leifsonia sp. 21MFCrub1.1 TaxID=1798223 RepID=UPI0008928272|nr:glycerol-3-phosphate dehydrogenase/oxidase [Leifsonia sp. 21MFCrub1.1]SEA36209.1 glycerol-3-phosphate dehydrogenase [Leifsonia sp. 21MFCrub1.1]